MIAAGDFVERDALDHAVVADGAYAVINNQPVTACTASSEIGQCQ